MKKSLVIACVVCIFVTYQSIEWLIAMTIVVFGACVVLSPFVSSIFTCHNRILVVDEMEEDIIFVLDKERKVSKHGGWLTFNQILRAIDVVDVDKNSVRKGCQISLNNLNMRHIIEIRPGYREITYRLIVEIDSEKGRKIKSSLSDKVPCAV